MDQITIPVKGMSCGGCVRSVQNALRAVEGVSEAEAELDPGQVTVHFIDLPVADDKLRTAIEDAGFDVPEGWTSAGAGA